MNPKSSKFISKKVGLVLAIIVIVLTIATGISLLVYFIVRNKTKPKPKHKSKYKPKSVPVLPFKPINESCKCKDYNSDRTRCYQGDHTFKPHYCLNLNKNYCLSEPLCVWN